MFGLKGYLAAFGAMAVLALGGYVWSLKRSNALLVAENAALARSVAALETQAEQSALAREVEAARAELWQVRAGELSSQIETILTGDFTDAPLDPDLADFVNGLHTAGP